MGDALASSKRSGKSTGFDPITAFPPPIAYFHVSKQHLHRYLAEFDFRYSNRSALGVEDTERTDRAIKGAKGKRLTYETARQRTGESPF